MQLEMLYLNAFQEDEIELGTDPSIKLNCDEAERRKHKATQKRVREDSRGDSQGHGPCED